MQFKSLLLFVNAFLCSSPLLFADTLVNSPTNTSSISLTPFTTPSSNSTQNNQQQGQGQKPTGPVLGKPQPSTTPELPKPEPIVKPEPVVTFEEPVYFFPGLVGKIGNRWVGSDYLYDTPINIGVKVQVYIEEGSKTKVETGELAADVKDIFLEEGINPQSETINDGPPLPFFHILILLNECESQVVACVAGRYFEPVHPDRFDFEPLGTFQAITWEYQDLIVVSNVQFAEQLKLSVEEIAKKFVERIKFYNTIKLESESPIQLYKKGSLDGSPVDKPKSKKKGVSGQSKLQNLLKGR